MNPRTYQNNHSPWSSSLHPRDAGIVQYMQMHQCNTLYKKIKGKKKETLTIMLLDAEKALDKILHPFILKELKGLGI